MSIAYEINRLKLNKQKVKEQVNVDKDIINEGREFIRGETVRHYPSGIKSMEMSYKDFIPVHTSTESLIETERGGTIIGKTLKGNTTQNGTPTPSSPVPVNNVTGLQTITISNGTNSRDYEVNLGNIELNKIGNYQDFIRKGTGKNLFDLENAYHGSINASGVEGRNESYRTTLYIPTTPNTNYYFSTTQISGQTANQIYIAYYDSTQTFISRTSYNLYESAFTTPSNCYYMRAGVYSAGQENIMLESGNTKTLYEPYGYKDKWYIEKNVLKLVVPNAVTGTMQNSNKRFYVNGIELGTRNILKNTQSSKTYGLYCDILEEKTAGQTWSGTQGISYDYNSVMNLGCIDFAISGLTTIAEYQNALKGKAIYAIANTPEYTLIDNEDLIEQLEKIMPLLEGQNNISVSGNLPTGIDVDYIERVNKHLISDTNESAE